MGASVGMAFQLYDDELDLVSSTQALGKPANNDLKNVGSSAIVERGH